MNPNRKPFFLLVDKTTKTSDVCHFDVSRRSASRSSCLCVAAVVAVVVVVVDVDGRVDATALRMCVGMTAFTSLVATVAAAAASAAAVDEAAKQASERTGTFASEVAAFQFFLPS